MLYRIIPLRQIVVFGVIVFVLHLVGVDLVTPAIDWLAAQLEPHVFVW